VPRLCKFFTLAFALQLRKKHGKSTVSGNVYTSCCWLVSRMIWNNKLIYIVHLVCYFHSQIYCVSKVLTCLQCVKSLTRFRSKGPFSRSQYNHKENIYTFLYLHTFMHICCIILFSYIIFQCTCITVCKFVKLCTLFFMIAVTPLWPKLVMDLV
jgi:hypothetical protein